MHKHAIGIGPEEEWRKHQEKFQSILEEQDRKREEIFQKIFEKLDAEEKDQDINN